MWEAHEDLDNPDAKEFGELWCSLECRYRPSAPIEPTIGDGRPRQNDDTVWTGGPAVPLGPPKAQRLGHMPPLGMDVPHEHDPS